MNIEHLRTFLDVAQTGSFHRSAERLSVSQSTVSARIKGLEERLDRVLFNRSKSGVTVTGAGQRLLRHADIAVAWRSVVFSRRRICISMSRLGTKPGLSFSK